MRYLIIISLLFWSVGNFAAADSLPNDSLKDPMQLFAEANLAYQDDNFSKSIDLYSLILEKGNQSSELHFNLGNAYFKLGDIPRSILHFEKAKKLNPTDEDISLNLEMANLKTIDKVESKPELMLTSWWNSFLNTYSIDEWAVRSIYLSFLALAAMLGFILSSGMLKKISFFTGIIIFTISIAFYVLGYQQKSLQTSLKYAIVFSPTVTVKGSPEDDGTRLFVIHEGTKIRVLDEFNDWSEVALMNGSKGWIKSGTFEGI